MVFDGTHYLAGYVAGTTLLGQRFDASGRLVGGPITIGSGLGWPPGAAFALGGPNVLVAWSTADGLMQARLVPPDGSPGPVISLGSGGQVRAVASDGANFLVVHTTGDEEQDGPAYGVYVSGAGQVLGQPFMLGDGVADLAVAYGGGNYLAAWQEPRGEGDSWTVARLVSPAAGPVGGPVTLSTTRSWDHNPLAIGFDGESFLVLWNCTTNFDGPGELMLYGRRVSSMGIPLGDELVIAEERATFPAIAFDGSHYLVVWSHQSMEGTTIHARWLDRTGRPVGPVFTPLAPAGDEPPFLPLNGLAFDGSRFVLAATFGHFVLLPSGEPVGFVGDVRGAFLSASTAPPRFVSYGLTNGFPMAQIRLVPGITYSVEVSTNLPVFVKAGEIYSADTNVLTVVDEQPADEQPHEFFRLVAEDGQP
ncbi:MAG: hypothetical protein D6766_01375 [Verrucomicrobia bacterium]|nr:MAG: hypothetical protein D6766_01375 [Verrucomicrobiota bacterium]